jgi:endonuclease/exonuclease/phosphatase (EEP) superfamily protein YafD
MPLGFNYDSRIIGSISDMPEACDLVNTHTLQHGKAPPTHKQGSRQIDFMFASRRLVKQVDVCGILPFDSIFASDHRPLFVDFNVFTLFGHPAFSTEIAAP